MEKRISRFERSTGFESFTDMVAETMQSARENGCDTNSYPIMFDAARIGGERGQSEYYQHWAGAVAVAWNRI